MLFLTLADASGLAECVLFPDAYRTLARAVRGEVVRVRGRVEQTLGAITLTVAGAAEVGPPVTATPPMPAGRNGASRPGHLEAPLEARY